jgi:hypothetical protein
MIRPSLRNEKVRVRVPLAPPFKPLLVERCRDIPERWVARWSSETRDISPKVRTYQQVLRSNGPDGMKLAERSTSSRFASRCVDRLGGRPFAISNLALHDIADLPADDSSGHHDGREPSEFPRPSLTVRPTDPPMTIPDRRAGGLGIDQPSMSRPLQRGPPREHRCDSTFDGLVHNHRSRVCSETFQGDVI